MSVNNDQIEALRARIKYTEDHLLRALELAMHHISHWKAEAESFKQSWENEVCEHAKTVHELNDTEDFVDFLLFNSKEK